MWGKSVLVAGLCRAYTRRGLKVLPFKPQNMSNNAAATFDGGEIGRAQWLQAVAANAEPSVHMNPVLLKPESETGAQVVVHGKVFAKAEAGVYQNLKPKLLSAVMESFEKLKSEADLVLVEGAGSPAEVNLRANDIANMGFALPSQTPVCLVGDINRGGVIAAIVGTHTLLPQEERDLIKGVIINQFRGDVSLFDGGIARIEEDTGWPSLGVVPFLRSVRELPAEDAVILEKGFQLNSDTFKVAVPLLTRISNFDDLDPLKAETGVEVVFCPPGTPLPQGVDLIVLPGSKATIEDLRFMKAEGWDVDVIAHVRSGGAVLGICGGYQMLGTLVSDPSGVEGKVDCEAGLGLLNVETVLHPEKLVTNTAAEVCGLRCVATGYEIHTGETKVVGECQRFMVSGERILGVKCSDKPIWGTYLHGIFEEGEFRKKFLEHLGYICEQVNHSVRVNNALDTFSDELEEYLDLDAILDLAR